MYQRQISFDPTRDFILSQNRHFYCNQQFPHNYHQQYYTCQIPLQFHIHQLYYQQISVRHQQQQEQHQLLRQQQQQKQFSRNATRTNINIYPQRQYFTPQFQKQGNSPNRIVKQFNTKTQQQYNFNYKNRLPNYGIQNEKRSGQSSKNFQNFFPNNNVYFHNPNSNSVNYFDQICSKCKQRGHLSNHCPLKLFEKSYTNIRQPENEQDFNFHNIQKTRHQIKIFCANCGMIGHYFEDCREPRFEDLLQLFHPLLIKNDQKTTLYPNKEQKKFDPVNTPQSGSCGRQGNLLKSDHLNNLAKQEFFSNQNSIGNNFNNLKEKVDQTMVSNGLHSRNNENQKENQKIYNKGNHQEFIEKGFAKKKSHCNFSDQKLNIQRSNNMKERKMKNMYTQNSKHCNQKTNDNFNYYVNMENQSNHNHRLQKKEQNRNSPTNPTFNQNIKKICNDKNNQQISSQNTFNRASSKKNSINAISKKINNTGHNLKYSKKKIKTPKTLVLFDVESDINNLNFKINKKNEKICPRKKINQKIKKKQGINNNKLKKKKVRKGLKKKRTRIDTKEKHTEKNINNDRKKKVIENDNTINLNGKNQKIKTMKKKKTIMRKKTLKKNATKSKKRNKIMGKKKKVHTIQKKDKKNSTIK
ncbi:DNAj [Anaeramoeba flamelloides]|uniref:DNAj n=1 Tax=Anaeramoeba flamelloides TaxID=1746091 RepID=A0AAV7ZFM0_9EUKA|nr:DNAj [Anaeramoeba flamelloides]